MNDWSKVPRRTDRLLVQQRTELGCGAAVGEMLLADRGLSVNQDTLLQGLPQPTDAPSLAKALSARSTLAWVGGALGRATPPDFGLVQAVSSGQLSWAALLEPGGPTRVGHWVAVDGVGTEGLVLVRDPVGSAYGIPMSQFLDLWRYTVLVIERGS